MATTTNFTELISKIKSVLSDDLLSPKYRKKDRKHVTEGHCYAGSEALYYLLGGKDSGLVPQVTTWTDADTDEKLSHWYLKDATGQILDPTKEQFTAKGQIPPYSLGRGCGFLTKAPSKRASIVMNRLQTLH